MQWLTREQARQLDATDAGLEPLAPLEGDGRSSEEVFRWTTLSLDHLSARGLRELVAGSASDSEWPNDGESIALRMAAAYPERVAGVLAAGARQHAEEDPELASWCVRCLVRMQCWGPEILTRPAEEFPWHYLKVECGDAFTSSGQWHAFAAALRDVGVESLGEDPLDMSDRSIGEFYARTGDEAGLPTRLSYAPWLISDSAWEDVADGSNIQLILEAIQIQLALGKDELVPIHCVGVASPRQVASLRLLAPRSYVATAALSELGHADARERLFWGVEAGVRAAHHAMDVDQAEVAWRSGCMTRLLEQALEHGGDWPFWAKFWLAEGNRAVVDLEGASFARRLWAVLSSTGGVSASRSPFTGGWGLVPSRDLER